MRKLLIIGFFLILFTCSFFVAGYYVLFDTGFSGSYTKALCKGNMCADYEFSCYKGVIVESKRISGFLVVDEDWVDTRDSENKC
ncbi:MAG: hypothetical protein ACP5N7_02510 [Candidatus Pacearchaeota archaeon]